MRDNLLNIQFKQMRNGGEKSITDFENTCIEMISFCSNSVFVCFSNWDFSKTPFSLFEDFDDDDYMMMKFGNLKKK